MNYIKYIIILSIFFINKYESREPIYKRTWEEMIESRDGVGLHTRFVFPKDDKLNTTMTVVLDRSPYAYTGLELMADIYLPWGFVSAGQDMRGTGKSEGDFTIWHTDADDAYDTMEWIAEQEWSNGEVYQIGASADGLCSFVNVDSSPEQLKAQFIIWSSSMGYEIIFPDGTYRQSLADIWIKSTLSHNETEADEALYEVEENEMHSEWWDFANLTYKYNAVHWPSVHWAGWYDIFLRGHLTGWYGYNYESDMRVQGQAKIVVDPLGHCQAAAQYFDPDLIYGRTALAFLMSFELYGVGEIKRPVKQVTFYVMSSTEENSPGNYWTTLDEWPKFKSTNYYLHSDGSLSQDIPSSDENDNTKYIYDPSNPAPTIGGNNLEIPCGPLDQTPNGERDDVLVFKAEPFDDDFAITGPLLATLYVGSDAIDTDFMVKIIDQYPTGEARLIQDSAIRMRWRDMGSEPIYMEDGEVYEVTVNLWNTSYIFMEGHSLQVQITSSNYPRFSINPNTGNLMVDEDFSNNVTANNIIYHSEKYPTHITLPKVSKIQLPEFHMMEMIHENQELLEKVLPKGKTLEEIDFFQINNTPWKHNTDIVDFYKSEYERYQQ